MHGWFLHLVLSVLVLYLYEACLGLGLAVLFLCIGFGLHGWEMVSWYGYAVNRLDYYEFFS